MKRKNLIRLLLALAALFTFLGSVHAQNATTLETKYRQLQNKLANNQFGQPVYMDSSLQSNTISGDVYSVVNSPYSTVRTALDTPTEWCEVLMLHLNIKYCRALGKNMAWLLKCLEMGAQHGLPHPENPKIATNFIR